MYKNVLDLGEGVRIASDENSKKISMNHCVGVRSDVSKQVGWCHR